MKLIFIILSVFGACWILLGIMLVCFGGSIKVIINNPITNTKDVITDININKKRLWN